MNIKKPKTKKIKHNDPEPGPAECTSRSSSPYPEGEDLFAANAQFVYSHAMAQCNSQMYYHAGMILNVLKILTWKQGQLSGLAGEFNLSIIDINDILIATSCSLNSAEAKGARWNVRTMEMTEITLARITLGI
jgi:hypothetical protein